MAIEALAIAGQLREPELNEKTDTYENTNSSVNPVVDSAEFALLVSTALSFLVFKYLDLLRKPISSE